MNYKIIAFLIVIVFMVLFFIGIQLYSFNTTGKPIEVDYYSILLQQPINEEKLFDLDFKYILSNNNTCRASLNTTILAVILITSYMGDVETRSAMRRAFPSELLQKYNLRRLFLLGTAPNDQFVKQNAIINENDRFRDLVQGNFKEAYKNLTYKHRMGLQWAAIHCNHAQYVIKMDDDIVVNMYKLVELLKDLKLPHQDVLAGYVLKGMAPVREPANKWYVTKEEYAQALYPTFMSGWFYITSPNVCGKLVKASLEIPFFWVDDVYITGLLAQEVRIEHYSLGNYFTVHAEFLQCCIRDVEHLSYECEIIVGPNGGDNNLFFKFNKAVSKCYLNKCYKRPKSLNQTCVAERSYPLGRGNALIETYKLI